ncbi:hypothetical protein [Ectothiorhodospira mobilis]|uniref:hypothetical protein n=1 Tax=Ectothiorhodospira mobilis TaxID=195064 RepID=UPI001908060E|nr:hypothetical protein [Ectothiorhodospira mobilis]
MAADLPIPPTHPSIPGRPVPEEGDDARRFPRGPRRREERKPEKDREEGENGPASGDSPQDQGPGERPGPTDDPDHIDEYA